ncbi:hypothetical protein SRABI106_04743 [Rahnella aquatilis]|nr:hypothetical protein SRABI106_04743 [Rahnella aquatilis]
MKASISGPTHTTRSALRMRAISEGRKAKSCGDVPSGSNTSVGITPSAMADAIKPSGRTEARTTACVLKTAPELNIAAARNIRLTLFFCIMLSELIFRLGENWLFLAKRNIITSDLFCKTL